MMGKKCGRLGTLSLGVGLGVAKGLCFLVFAWAGWFAGFGTNILDMMGSVYPGVAPSLMGGIMGLVWGFISGFIFGILIAFFYNLCLCCCKKCPGCGSAQCSCESGMSSGKKGK